MEPPIQPPVQPPLQPTGPSYQPPRRKLPAAAIISIVIGAIAFISLPVIAAIVTRDSTDSKTQSSNRIDELAPPDQDPKSNPANIGPTKTYKNARISFAYPDTLTEKDTSNVTTFYTDGSSPSETKVFLSDEKVNSNSAAIIDYAMIGGQSTTPVPRERRLSTMKQGVENQKNASKSQVTMMRESSAHGCAADFAYTQGPQLIEKGELIGMRYGYTCKSYFGAVQGEYFVWFDEYGAKHSLVVDADADYWKKHTADLEAVTRSVSL
jgi:hypothetical protein